MSSLKIIFIAISLMTIFGCNNGIEETSSETKGLINSTYGWSGGYVKTCFINQPVNTSRTELYIQAIQSNFKKSSVGIEFTGFESCDYSPSAQIKILIS